MKMNIKKIYDEEMQLQSIVVVSSESDILIHFTIANYGVFEYNNVIRDIVKEIKSQIPSILHCSERDMTIHTSKYDICITEISVTENYKQLYFKVNILYNLTPLNICPTCRNEISPFNVGNKEDDQYIISCPICNTDIIYEVRDKKIDMYTVIRPMV